MAAAARGAIGLLPVALLATERRFQAVSAYVYLLGDEAVKQLTMKYIL